MSVSLSATSRRLDALTGRWTMYRLTVVLLLAMTAWSFVLSAAGQLFYTPAELAATAATAVASSLVASRVMGLLFRTRPQTDSSLITGLLLFFLFWPTTEGSQLLTVALAAGAATASKYLLVWRGRHIFNPAAFGAALLAVTGLNSAVWWVAAPLMLVVVLPAAALILYRNRLLPMAGVFLLASGAIIIARFLSGGEPLTTALATLLASYPVLFFAGFMLSEPLTLPPRRWQRLLEAAVVGVLFALPLNLGPVYMSPELALLLGNLLAFALAPRAGIRLRLRENRALTPTARELVFEPLRPLKFRPGQYVELSLPHASPDARGARRIFSLTTAPEKPETVAVGLRVTEPVSSFKSTLLKLKPGAVVTGTSVAGDFLLPRRPGVPLLLVASGVGITPFMSQLRSLAARGQTGAVAGASDIVLVYAASSVEELAYAAELHGMGIRVLVCTPTDPQISGWTWLGPGLPDAQALVQAVPDIARRAAYVSGSPGAVAAARAAVRGAGGRTIKTDAFLGY
ncbi:FAD-dependent oxidoreductase [Arthrobacter gengyunqii]|uniref:FAD-dependent oxidoreductase n=1 Tax=Arthrobacter gengyunqii TaxID=2886940 RepID=A0A9X1LYG5_9MICC|nr:FAD-dependent oxidoreductase [Arthrobacter gengyunqii]MCC3267876.1 FAD-dependent oxidoreductase [Arthrobacter gengyunqii]UOY95302.1 FAD-dependent oxidoreductase [Arthrobacter gengyunqii]